MALLPGSGSDELRVVSDEGRTWIITEGLKPTPNNLARCLTEDPDVVNDHFLVDAEYSGYHPHVFTLVTQLPKSFHPNRPTALVEFEYVAASPEAYGRPDNIGAVSVLRIVVEGYHNVTTHMLPTDVYEDIRRIGFDAIRDADEVEIDQSRGEHEIW
jgi:hypothetical protein